MSLGSGIRIFVSFVVKNCSPIIREFSEVVRWPQDSNSNSSSRPIYVWPAFHTHSFSFLMDNMNNNHFSLSTGLIVLKF